MNKNPEFNNVCCAEYNGYGAMLNRGFAIAKTDGTPNGNRTHVTGMRIRCPGPLDDGSGSLFMPNYDT